jgi:hypothetical protein
MRRDLLPKVCTSETHVLRYLVIVGSPVSELFQIRPLLAIDGLIGCDNPHPPIAMSPSMADTSLDSGSSSKVDEVCEAAIGTIQPLSQRPKTSVLEQSIRTVLFVTWFTLTCVTIVATQLVGVPLVLFDRKLFYAYFGGRSD